MSDATQTADYTTDMQTIRDYVQSVVEAQGKIATAYLAALDNFQITVQTASPAEARPDIFGAVLKSALKTTEKLAVKAVEDSTGADLGPLVELLHSVSDEIDRAAAAAQSLAVSEWIKSFRTAVANAYTQGQTGEALRQQIESEYNQNDEGGRGGYIAGIQNELQAMRTVQAPASERLQVSMYESWINQNFNNDCMDGTGIISLQFNADGTKDTATVIAPLGARVAAALNGVVSAPGVGITRLMDLNVVKRV